MLTIILEGRDMTALRVSKSEVEGAICTGIRKAYREYLRWTGDEGLHGAPEYLLTCAVARELVDVEEGCYVTLEAGMRETLEYANVCLDEVPRVTLRLDGRADVVLWVAPEVGQDGVPRAIVEVKNYLAEPGARLFEDVARLRDALELSVWCGGALEFGCLAFWLGVDEPRQKVRHDTPVAWLQHKSRRLWEVAQELVCLDGLEARLVQPKFYQGAYDDGTRYAWAPSVLVIEKPTE
ncbi:hypothetical protein ACFFU8_01895 [Chromobacterium piscinae]|uniref:hypothetical protein n=1 Tax=Chromobacterium piscinae TaxID=686831 RepID=UPI001E563653|nr:hypothetical protein [Chromobacterium piscinae]MCD5329272.1 hypothetical protein [Chromobacterium piscinae]